MIYTVRSLILSFVLSFVLPVAANAAALSFTQSNIGTISAVFSSSGCGLNPVAPATATLSASQFNISSQYAVFDPPPSGCNSTYTVTALLGTVANGHYTVVWAYGTEEVTGQFDVVSGALQVATVSAPTLSDCSLLALALSIAALAGIGKRALTIRSSGPLR